MKCIFTVPPLLCSVVHIHCTIVLSIEYHQACSEINLAQVHGKISWRYLWESDKFFPITKINPSHGGSTNGNQEVHGRTRFEHVRIPSCPKEEIVENILKHEDVIKRLEH